MSLIFPFRLRRFLLTGAGVWLIGVLLLCGGSARAQEQGDGRTIPEAAFWRQIAAVQEQVAALRQTAPPDQGAQLAALAAQLEAITAVTRRDGVTVSLSLASITQLMRADPPDLPLIEARLAALLAGRGGGETAVFGDAALAPLETILADDAYQYRQEPSWLAQRWRELNEWFNQNVLRYFPGLNDPALDLAEIVLLVAAVVALAAVLYYVFRDLFTDFVASAALPPDAGDAAALSADAALQRAQDLSGGGDYRTAVRYLYLSALLLLEERDLLRYDRSLTNREYLRSLAGRPRLAAALRDVIEVFDRVWYGFQSLDAAEYDWYRQRVEALKRQGGD